MHILVVEDDGLLGRAIARALAQSGHQVDWEQTGLAGLERLKEIAYGVALIDLGLPDISGIDVIRDARDAQVTVPIIIMTARDDIRSKVDGLDAGADDYMSKPFHLDELGARIRSVARRTREPADNIIEAGDLCINLDSFEVQVGGHRVDITRREFALLSILASHAGHIVHRNALESQLYGGDAKVGTNALEVLVHSVRRKIGASQITTVRGMGYLMPSRRDR
ncbi:response regulator [Luteibacter sp.]|uniref:response regulator n=1 Tax=Luteibacter sp. TaxID=1886636 RepID=UPI003F82124D